MPVDPKVRAAMRARKAALKYKPPVQPVRRGKGRPAFVPTDAQRATVRSMAAYGILQSDIATVLDIDDKTLRKCFRRELDTAAIEANARVAQSLHTMATKGANVVAAIWWSKARMGWSERLPTDKDGNAPKITIRFGTD